MLSDINDRVKKLRTFMRNNNIQAFIVPSTDPHSGEYIAQHWECRKWISGFTGSAGTVVITTDKAGLWTDSRYFIQAEEQLRNTCFTLFKEKLPNTPTITEWLSAQLAKGDKVGIDPWTNSITEINSLKDSLKQKSIDIKYVCDPFDEIWTDRPTIPKNKIFIHDIKYAGVSAKEKIAVLKEYLASSNRHMLVVSALDEICWILNLRGNDIHCNPVFISYLTISKEKTSLYIDADKITPEVNKYLTSQEIHIYPYEQIGDDIEALANDNFRIEFPTIINGGVFSRAPKGSIIASSPVALMKAVKNKTEIKGFHDAMTRDGVAMVKFLKWIKDAVRKGGESELSISKKLYDLRSEQDKFVGESFDTIAGYKDNAAIVHYEADEKSNRTLEPEGMLLLDSGAQYLDGTTDITRTIILGKITEEERLDYTLVLKGMIDLAMTEFPHGTCGTQIDAFARMAMWQYGINYMHGTGHGVGHFLNVHEGPHQIRMNNMPTPLLPGMTVTDEPGIYKEGRYGIRIENTMLVVKSKSTEFGDFYKLEPLTLCPIDKEGINIDILEEKEIDYLNQYHENVYTQLSPYLSNDEKEWLKRATLPINK